jgi:uncharacterized protein
MASKELRSFPLGVAEHLKIYVYRLIDPRNGETFYVGKGKGNRVFAHIHDELGKEGDTDIDKLRRIREIRLADLAVGHVIHRHGMDDPTAFAVESALIEAYPGLTNDAGGTDANEFGVMHAAEIIAKYEAKPAEFRHSAVLITVNQSSLDRPLIDAVRWAWKVDVRRAERSELVMAVVRGVIKGVYVAEKWMRATKENFPGWHDRPDRFGFVGREADPSVRDQYVGKRLPDEMRKRGAANPIKYVGTR